jgi:hypothetical protein
MSAETLSLATVMLFLAWAVFLIACWLDGGK